jgi:hypothetical protein
MHRGAFYIWILDKAMLEWLSWKRVEGTGTVCAKHTQFLIKALVFKNESWFPTQSTIRYTDWWHTTVVSEVFSNKGSKFPNRTKCTWPQIKYKNYCAMFCQCYKSSESEALYNGNVQKTQSFKGTEKRHLQIPYSKQKQALMDHSHF